MSGCNATLTTATVSDVVVLKATEGWTATLPSAERIPDGATVVRQGDRLVRVDLHTIECWREDSLMCSRMHINAMSKRVEWTDDTPGARPHTDPLVTDAEVQAAHDAYRNIWDEPTHGRLGPAGIRELLEAAARVRGDDA